MRVTSITCGLIVASLFAFACSSGSSTPTITITSPADGATVAAGTDAMKSIPVAFTLTNFTLAAPGPNEPGVGHIHVLVDGAACTPAAAPYDNADVSASPAMAQLSTCPAVAGPHTITLELHNNDHSAVTDSSGNIVAAKVSITAQ